jgi:hypothetical protein
MPNYLILSIDGLQCGMLGAYGNTWIHTPTLDALACQSALFDRFYASTLDLSDALSELWQTRPLSPWGRVRVGEELQQVTCAPHPSPLPKGEGTNACHKILFTDDSDVFLHEHAALFDEKHRTEAKRRNQPAAKIEETQFYRNMANIADLLRNRSDQPFLLWAHFEGFRGHWDFPLSYRQRYQIDEDPDPYADVAPPEMLIDKNIDPDVVQAIREAYSGGVTVLDEALSGLLAFLEESGLDKNTVLLFMSARGFSLGEHHRIGANEELYGENVHLPLFIRFPDGKFASFRSPTLLQPGDIFALLQKDDLPEDPDAVHSSLRIGEGVIVTPDWYVYRKPSGVELYVKPDDRWEVNDVADRCPHVIEEIV